MSRLLFNLFCVLAFSTFVLGQSQSTEIYGDIVQRKASDFSYLPKNISKYLDNHNYRILPAVRGDNSLGGFYGAFNHAGQNDWVVLCSRNGFSTILIFWNGFTNEVAEIAKADDRKFIKRDEKGNYYYYRKIGLDNVSDLIEENASLFVEDQPKIDHFGIDETTTENKEVVYYLHKGQWLVLKRQRH